MQILLLDSQSNRYEALKSLFQKVETLLLINGLFGLDVLKVSTHRCTEHSTHKEVRNNDHIESFCELYVERVRKADSVEDINFLNRWHLQDLLHGRKHIQVVAGAHGGRERWNELNCTQWNSHLGWRSPILIPFKPVCVFFLPPSYKRGAMSSTVKRADQAVQLFMGPHLSERSKHPGRLAQEFFSVPHGTVKIWEKGKNGKERIRPQPWRWTERTRANTAFKKMLAKPQVQKPQFNKGDIVIFSPDGFPFPLSSWVNRTYFSEEKESYEIARITEVVHNPPTFTNEQKYFLIGANMRGGIQRHHRNVTAVGQHIYSLEQAQNEQDKKDTAELRNKRDAIQKRLMPVLERYQGTKLQREIAKKQKERIFPDTKLWERQQLRKERYKRSHRKLLASLLSGSAQLPYYKLEIIPLERVEPFKSAPGRVATLRLPHTRRDEDVEIAPLPDVEIAASQIQLRSWKEFFNNVDLGGKAVSAPKITPITPSSEAPSPSNSPKASNSKASSPERLARKKSAKASKAPSPERLAPKKSNSPKSPNKSARASNSKASNSPKLPNKSAKASKSKANATSSARASPNESKPTKSKPGRSRG